MESQDSSREKLTPICKPEPSLEEWLATIDCLRGEIEPILEEVCHSRGRRPYPYFPMFKAAVCRTRLPSLRQLNTKLNRDSKLLASTGLSKVPTHQTFSNFLMRLGEERLRRIFNILIKALKKLYPGLGKHLSVDGTVIRAYARRNRGFLSRADPDAKLGFKEIKAGGKKDFEFGYRSTIACDTELEIPVEFVVTPANANETRLMPRILRQTKERGLDFEYVIADKQYDSRLNRTLILYHKAIPIIPIKKGRKYADFLDPIRQNSDEWSELYARRTASERLFSSLKEHGGFRTLKNRRLGRVTAYLTLCLIGKQLAALSAIRLGRMDLTRSMLVWGY